MLEGTARVRAVGVELAVYGRSKVLAFLGRAGMCTDAFLVCASCTKWAFVAEIDGDACGSSR